MPNPTRGTTAGRVYNDLRNLARRTNRSTDEIMVEYVLERFLYRLAISPLGREHFVLKGGLLLAQFGARRTTRDIDILGRSFPGEETEIVRRIAAIAATETDDGVAFDPATLKTVPIREEDEYHGLRLSMAASIARARLKLQLDVSFGDPVTPRPADHRLPAAAHLGELPDPRLPPRHCHRREAHHRHLARRPQHP
ncbi:nucleotidyl transferase AbiEii/AbiGii toxin family protein [Streptomyces sp. NBC_01216]|uniref:nucleotidyl transferase AbiEii/AbiGii toxin family protein n=1 Tax=Streptomyces sp. NBC_01216 TaxID=2903778 RepID=UPI002E156E27|nr:nucleotidyl transferase AbiEii/AbiGii toxin family protein [Streptomyces sp. NBC_01216]